MSSTIGELWRAISVAPDYAVSSLGRIKRLTAAKGTRAEHILAGGRATSGYRTVGIVSNGAGKTFHVHSLVCAAFHGPKPDGCEVAHANGVRFDNRVENLRWTSRKDNAADRVLHGTAARGEFNGNAKSTASDVQKIRADPRRLSAIARDYGVSPTTVHNMKKGKTWKSLAVEA